jgi:hypothetical protein
LVLFIVTYVVPMSAMAGCYTAMGRELWGSRSIGEMTQRQIDSIRSKRKVSKSKRSTGVLQMDCNFHSKSEFLHAACVF